MKDYLIWYQLENDSEDRVRGMSRNWENAEVMAERLYYQLKIFDKIAVVCTGVKRVEHGKLYEDNECSLRWQVYPPEEKI